MKDIFRFRGKSFLFVQLFFVLLLIIITMAIAGGKQRERACLGIQISISNQVDNYFIEDSDIMKLMDNDGQLVIVGASFDNIDLRGIEHRVKSVRFVKDAEIFKDLEGQLIVNVELRRPVARIVRKNGPGAYIGSTGVILPTSEKFTSRVVLISGPMTDSLVHEETLSIGFGSPYFDLINFINEDDFWRAQIAEIEIDAGGEITLWPQVTKQKIEFGSPKNIENKFKRLMVFYKEILPRNGWNSYSRVNLKYENQIVCE